MSLSIKRRGRIVKYLGEGKVSVVIDDGTDKFEEYQVDIPLAYASPDGAFIGGYPEIQTGVTIEQGQGGWYISGYLKPDNVFDNLNISGSGGIFGDIMSDLSPNRLLIQSKKAANRIYLESPSDDDLNGTNEIVAGNGVESLQVDLKRSIISHNIANQYQFSYAHREIVGTIKRDISDNSLRDVEGSILDDRGYDDNLWLVGMDPSLAISPVTSGSLTRNLSLIENRRIIYEFANISSEQNFEEDKIELSKIDPNYFRSNPTNIQRPESRAVTFGLNLYYPNHLFEEIKGTGVDTFGNVIDLNRSILPLGKGDLSFVENANNEDAFIKIRDEHRKAISYHFEINTRKENGAMQKIIRGEDGIPDPSVTEDSLLGVYEPLSIDDFDNYSRDRSSFFVDIDKEGQFKLNIPMSSEVGNVPLHARYLNSSVIAWANEDIETPNDMFLEDEGIDIYLENYTNNPKGVKLKGPEGQIGPIDRATGELLELNMVYHDILTTGDRFLNSMVPGDLAPYQPDSSLNFRKNEIQFDNFVTEEVNVKGPNANAGGRSGTINLDGFLNFSVGANTVDKQSMWFDTAGGIVVNLGRDRRGVSSLTSCDGDMLVQIGGPSTLVTPNKKTDTRFAKENSTPQSGALDIRVIKSDGQLTIVRIDEKGVSIASQGKFEVMSQQDIVFNSNTNIILDAPNIGFYYKNSPRFIERNQIKNI